MKTYPQPSHLSNPKTQQNIGAAEGRAKTLQSNTVVVNKVTVVSNTYNTTYRTTYVNRTTVFQGYYRQPQYHYYYSGWYGHGFYGGYYYPVRPFYDIHLYFWYPVVYWFYVDSWDPWYYQTWYPDYNNYVVEPFHYARVFYPTDTLRDLGMEVSAMPTVNQYNFREGMENLMDSVSTQISDNLSSSIQFGPNDVVINHYENLNDQAIVVEGFVDRDDMHFVFKGLIDLNDPTNTMAFVPAAQNPSDDELYNLQLINDRISALGGNPYVADQEPEQ